MIVLLLLLNLHMVSAVIHFIDGIFMKAIEAASIEQILIGEHDVTATWDLIQGALRRESYCCTTMHVFSMVQRVRYKELA